jgi:hypothetical protein
MENNYRELKNSPKILGLDVSTKVIGWALFEMKDLKLLELKHFSPKIKPQPEDKIEELIKKAEAFKKTLIEYKSLGIVKVIIEEPLLNSNNVYTVQTLLRYNTLITQAVWDVFGIIPNFISTYNSRKYAFPELVQANPKGQKVLFGGYDKGCDKKQIVWELVASKEPQIEWFYTKTGTLKKENFDMSDAAACVFGYMNKLKEEK